MKYLDAVQKLKNIETQYDVMSIVYRGVSIWPFLRIYLLDELLDNHSHISTSRSAIKTTLKCLFYYNPFIFFKHYKVWLFNASERRKLIGSKYVHRVSGAVNQIENNTLTIEKPNLQKGHYPIKDIEEKNILSESWLLILTHIIKCVMSIFTIKLSNAEIIERIIADNRIKFEYKKFVKLLVSQKNAMDCMLFISHKPEVIFIECPYTSMGYVWAFHNNGIKVIEMQHGVLNGEHYAYNSKFHSTEFYPDEVCVYGDIEYQFFTKINNKYCNTIHKTGLYVLEYSDRYFKQDVFAEYRHKYASIILVSGQRSAEPQLANFIDQVAACNPNLLFVYVPRSTDNNIEFASKNVIYCPDVNIYQYLKWCDIHCTISSTTCLESQYFHKPTIFYNYDNMSVAYYGRELYREHGVRYINNVNEFKSACESVSTSINKYKELFSHNHMDTIHTILSQYCN